MGSQLLDFQSVKTIYYAEMSVNYAFLSYY